MRVISSICRCLAPPAGGFERPVTSWQSSVRDVVGAIQGSVISHPSAAYDSNDIHLLSEHPRLRLSGRSEWRPRHSSSTDATAGIQAVVSRGYRCFARTGAGHCDRKALPAGLGPASRVANHVIHWMLPAIADSLSAWGTEGLEEGGQGRIAWAVWLACAYRRGMGDPRGLFD